MVDTPGGDYWRDSSPLGPSHSSRNLREQTSNRSLQPSGHNSPYMLGQQGRVHSMAGLSMWGPGSNYGGPGGHDPNAQQAGFMHPMMTGQSHNNPFDSPGSEMGSMRAPTFYPPYASSPLSMGMGMGMPMMSPQQYPQQPHPGMMGMGAPRNTVLSNLGGMAAQGAPGLPTRMSTFSLATTANPLGGGGGLGGVGGGAPLVPNESSSPGDEEVVGVLKRYLASQDLMSV